MLNILKKVIDHVPYPLGISKKGYIISLNPEAATLIGQTEIFTSMRAFFGTPSDIAHIRTPSNRLITVRTIPLAEEYTLLIFTESNQNGMPRDELTGLLSRPHLQYLGPKILKEADPNRKVVIMFVDLDEFKQVNDTLGHEAGDDALKEVSRRITSLLRASDLCFRWGGDEFIIIAQGISEKIHTGLIARRVIRAINQPMTINGRLVEIGVSIGIAVAPDDGTNFEELLRKADKAMYEAKRVCKNTYVLTTE